jgi:hypothetical protein
LLRDRTYPDRLSNKSRKLTAIQCRGQTYPVCKIGQSGLQNRIL